MSEQPSWERWSQRLADWMPYATLAIATVLGLLQPRPTAAEKAGTVALAVAAGAWVYLLYTRAPAPRGGHSPRMRVYFAGLLVLAAWLIVRERIFFIFLITGFFHASQLRPFSLTVAGIAVTSILINTLTSGFPWESIEEWTIFGSITVIQVVVLGLGTVLGEKLNEVSEQRRLAVAKLEAALRENASLQAQLVSQAREAGVLDERQRMAREIHDTLAQGLTGIITQLEAAEQAQGLPEAWRRHLHNASRLARASLAEARRSVEAGRPVALDKAPLPEALATAAREWTALNGVPVDVTTTGDPVRLHPDVETALLRTAQEALANVAKHARASRVGVTLSYMGDEVSLDVRDDGVGFVAPNGSGGREAGAGFGLSAMRQRVSRVAGTLDVESAPGEGTAISARVPALAAQPEERDT
jgi:signal transduction histidine kinase